MAIENEIKYVLCSDELEQILCPLYGYHDVIQGYMNNSNRIRKSTYQNGKEDCYFTFKHRLPNGKNIEIEKNFNSSEFEELWEFTKEKVSKRRVSIFPKKDEIELNHWKNVIQWDIDFIRWGSGKNHFIIAEVEMLSFMEKPLGILPILKPYIIHEVAKQDNRFTARKLSDEKHAIKLAKELGLIN